jgi:release factor glutamine methyltransferase
MSDRPETVLAVLEAASQWLERQGVDAPRRSVELLIQHVLGLTRLQVYLAHDRPLSVGELDSLRGLVARRARHEPVAHLLGSWEFHGHELEVGPAVLIPRPETEGLVDLALSRLDAGAQRVVDLGTGSGAIAIALAKGRADLHVTAVDVSPDALAVARRNVERHGLADRIRLVEGSWWEPLADEAPFDGVVSNPPYVDPARSDLVASDVAQFEPGLALWTPSGLPGAPFEAIAAGIAARVRPGAPVLCETGAGAEAASRAAFESCSALGGVELLDDLEGRPRYLVARVEAASGAASGSGDQTGALSAT